VEEKRRRLDQIETLWPLVRGAQSRETPSDAASRKAATELLMQYQEAIYAYLLGALRDADAANEVFQEFALRFARRDFHRADPSKGRFRDLLKKSLSNQITKYRTRQQILGKKPARDSADTAAPAEADLEAKLKADLLKSLIDSAWVKLAKDKSDPGPPFYEVLRLQRDSPALTSEQIANHLCERHPGKTFTDGQVRQILHRAREKLADLLVNEVCRSSRVRSKEALEAELADLGLLERCQRAVLRRPIV
jgi:RNA polymerase sigma factor (sigma-70 family)